MSSDVRTSIPSSKLNQSFAWVPVVFIDTGTTACGVEVHASRRLAPQATIQEAYAAARKALSDTAEAIGFTVERVLACLLPKNHSGQSPRTVKSESRIKWQIRTLSGAVLGRCESHSEATQRIDKCQAEPFLFPEWLTDLRIQRIEVGA